MSNRRDFLRTLGVVPFIKIPEDRTLYSLISSKAGDLRITSYNRTAELSTHVYYDLQVIDPRRYDEIEEEIIKIAESLDWTYHFAELYEFGVHKDLADVTIKRLVIYKDHFGTYRYREVKPDEKSC